MSVSASNVAVSQSSIRDSNCIDLTRFGNLDSLVNANWMSDPDLARIYARQAYAMAKKSGSVKNIVRSMYLVSRTMSSMDQDSSVFILNSALSLSKKYQYDGETAGLLYSLALLYTRASETKLALRCLDSARVIAQKNNQNGIVARIYNSLGNAYLEAHDSTGSMKMFQMAFELAQTNHDYTLMGTAKANLAQFSKSIDDYANGLKTAIGLLQQLPGNEEEIAQCYINLGLIEANPDVALKYYTKALLSGRKGGMAESQLGALNNMVYSLIEVNRVDSAESCIKNFAVPLATQTENHNWLATLYDTYSDILIHQGRFREASENLKKSVAEKSIDDHQRSVAHVRLLAAIMDTKNKEQALAKSNEELEFNKVIVKLQYLAGVVMLLIASVVIMVLIIRNQRSKIKLKNREIELSRRMMEFEEHQANILGRELHDVVSNLMQRLSGHVKNHELHSQDSAVQTKERIEELVASIRAIAHRMNKLDFSKTTLRDILQELSTDMINLTGIDLVLDIPVELPALSEPMSRNTYRIIQELLTNAGKYAAGAKVKVTVGTINDRLVIAYQDNGPGFNPLIQSNDGIGLTGIRDRAEFFGGTALVETSPGHGLSWIISLPLQQNKN